MKLSKLMHVIGVAVGFVGVIAFVGAIIGGDYETNFWIIVYHFFLNTITILCPII